MRFLLDQSTDARLGESLRADGHDVARVGHDHPGGIADEQVLALARQERRILIVEDRDFGDLVFRRGLLHSGVIFLRLGDYAPLSLKLERIEQVLTGVVDELDEFIVVSRQRVRVRRTI